MELQVGIFGYQSKPEKTPLTSFEIREIKIKTTVGYHYKPTRLAKKFYLQSFKRMPIIHQLKGVFFLKKKKTIRF